VLGCLPFNCLSTVTLDASETGIGGVLEQKGHSIICVPRRMNAAEKGYSQTLKEALAIVWTIKRLHKFLYGRKFHLISNHQYLSYIFNPEKSINKCTSAMLTRWAVTLSAYNYSIEHRAVNRILQSDFLSRHCYQEKPPDKELLFLRHLSIDRNTLILQTRLAFAAIISSLKHGCSNSSKKRFPSTYKRRHELSLSPDGLIYVSDNPLVPPVCRQKVLELLHSRHMGVEKIKSLACNWPEIQNDIYRISKECVICAKKPKLSNWKPWPLNFKAMQRVHAHYCGPFRGKYYALIVIDSFSRFPEVFLTTHATADFTQRAFQKFFSREGIPQCVVTDNRTHFSAETLKNWIKEIGSSLIFTASRHSL